MVSFLPELGPQYASAKNQILTGVELPNLNSTFPKLSRIHVKLNQLLNLLIVLPLSPMLGLLPTPLGEELEAVAMVEEEGVEDQIEGRKGFVTTAKHLVRMKTSDGKCMGNQSGPHKEKVCCHTCQCYECRKQNYSILLHEDLEHY